ncbi:MAG TPA: acyl-CoA desaturase [Thermoanaerobaculia bacterium]|jgi:linoleoyl-CoA desaturase|nr:acyl-CoA desaturase [Thermoanaerobaculia bacterium]
MDAPTNETRRFKYEHGIVSLDFSRALGERVDAYFDGRGLSRHANLEMVSKTVLGFALWIVTWVWMMTGHFSALSIVGVYVVHGFAQLHMAFNIAHDANHGAYSKSRTVNRIFACVFDLVGASSYMWRLLHNSAHHSFVNIRGADTTLISGRIFRFSPHDERRPIHRYQHLYASFIYSLSTLDWTLTKDFRWLACRRFGNRDIVKHPLHELVILFAGKAFYLTYVLVIPLLYLDVPWYSIIAGFVVMHLILGFILALIFQPNHFNENAAYPEADGEGRISNDYIQHIFDTTSDYARGHPFTIWILGGLNLHIIHHMFPTICHVHYSALTSLVKSTAEEFGLPYRENRTISGAFLAHLRWLKTLGNGDPRSTS